MRGRKQKQNGEKANIEKEGKVTSRGTQWWMSNHLFIQAQ